MLLYESCRNVPTIAALKVFEDNEASYLLKTPFSTDLLECGLSTENQLGFHVATFILHCNTVLS